MYMYIKYNSYGCEQLTKLKRKGQKWLTVEKLNSNNECMRLQNNYHGY